MINKSQFSKIGIGTWGIGGFATRDKDNDDQGQINTLAEAITKGLNYIEVSMWSAEGYSAYLLSKAIKKSGIKREGLFITFVGYPYNVDSLDSLEVLLNNFLKFISSDFIDSFQSSSSTYSKFGKKQTDEFVNKLLAKGKTRYTSFTNGNLENIVSYHKLFGDKLIAHEVCFNFEIRINEELGIIDYARKNNLVTAVYQPLRRNRTALQRWSLLIELAKKYGVTQNQLLLNWIASKNFLPLVKTSNIEHLEENLKSLDFKMIPPDIEKLNNFRAPYWVSPEIDWSRSGDGKIERDGLYIDQLPNIFDDEYAKQSKNKQ